MRSRKLHLKQVFFFCKIPDCMYCVVCHCDLCTCTVTRTICWLCISLYWNIWKHITRYAGLTKSVQLLYPPPPPPLLLLSPSPPLPPFLSLSPSPSLSLSPVLLTDHLAQLILLSGGCLVSSVEESTALGNSTTCVVCDEKRFMQLPSGCGLVQIKSKWILDCLSNYR